jgi:uncharacterized protein DUF4255
MTGQHQIIKDTTETLVQMLTNVFKDHGYKRVHVIVEAPKPDAIEGKLPAVCVYLYQVGPNWEGTGLGVEYEETHTIRTNEGKIIEVNQRPPTWVRLDFLISTWAQTPEDEQLLLGLAIKCLYDTHYLEKSDLKGDSFPKGYDLPISLAGRLDEGTLARFWGSLNQPIRPAINMWTIVPIMSDVQLPFKRVEERVIGYERLGIRGGGEKEIGPERTPDMPPEGVFVKRTK